MDGTPVTLHVYDIANTENENLNSIVKFVNNVSNATRAGGIYHGASDILLGHYAPTSMVECYFLVDVVMRRCLTLEEGESLRGGDNDVQQLFSTMPISHSKLLQVP
jgi:hypothetical protein